MRITRKQLDGRVDTVNRLLGFDPDEVSWNTIGAFRLSGAYGGWSVERVVNEHGGVNAPMYGHFPARECYQFLGGMIEALYLTKDARA